MSTATDLPEWLPGHYVRMKHPGGNTVGFIVGDPPDSSTDPRSYLDAEGAGWELDLVATGVPGNPADFDLQYDGEHLYPFFETEDATIVGYGHADRAEFAELVRQYDVHVGGVAFDDGAGCEPEDVGHAWAVQVYRPDGEQWFRWGGIVAQIPGAFPVTVVFR